MINSKQHNTQTYASCSLLFFSGRMVFARGNIDIYYKVIKRLREGLLFLFEKQYYKTYIHILALSVEKSNHPHMVCIHTSRDLINFTLILIGNMSNAWECRFRSAIAFIHSSLRSTLCANNIDLKADNKTLRSNCAEEEATLSAYVERQFIYCMSLTKLWYHCMSLAILSQSICQCTLVSKERKVKYLFTAYIRILDSLKII